MTSVKKLKGVFGLVGAVTATASAVTSLRRARTDKDRLLLANAIASFATAITGALLAVRAVRKDDDK
ncbi:MAG TPA: hypothetical protein VFV67_05820 [Actinophytocola sp.]|uniref:hypothetical protein n=1 Tax=Actinophytocola sp. TaxID=1872138 RepID=UPI002DBA4ECA|nr:hypothetical protein [Actinophytocola sp.]HEU5470153.1 hypothetical protein [Actinophytocola sp.]